MLFPPLRHPAPWSRKSEDILCFRFGFLRLSASISRHIAQKLAHSVSASRRRADGRKRINRFRLMPLLQSHKHVFSRNQKKLRIGIKLVQLAGAYRKYSSALRGEFPCRSPRKRRSFSTARRHMARRSCGRRKVGCLLMRRHVCRNHQTRRRH